MNTPTSKEKNYLDKLKEIGRQNNAKLLTKEWQGGLAVYEFLLEDNRIYKSNSDNLTYKGWPKDINLAILTRESNEKTPEKKLQELSDIAKSNSGFLISTEWTKIVDKYIFAFSDGTRFERSGYNMKKLGWPSSDQAKYLKNYSRTKNEHLEDLKLFAIENNAKLLATKWEGIRKDYLFEKNGKTFFAKAQNLRHNGFPLNSDSFIKRQKSATNTGEENLENLRVWAIKHGGKLNSDEWKGASAQYEFYDTRTEQTFYRTASSVKNGYWIEERGLMVEPICRQIFEHVFNKKFPSTRQVLNAKLLKRGAGLELDGYNSDLKIAFEYQGHPSHNDITHELYEKVNKRDNIKKQACKNLGIILIDIPAYSKHSFSTSNEIFEHVLNSIIKTFAQNKIKMPVLNLTEFTIDFSKISYSLGNLEKMQKMATENGSTLLSKEWTGYDNTYLFTNKDGETFEARFAHLISKGWPKDIDAFIKKRNTYYKPAAERLNEIKNIAIQNGGSISDEIWMGNTYRYNCVFSNGKNFRLEASSIKSGRWPKDFDTHIKISKLRYRSDDEKLNEIKEIALQKCGAISDEKWMGNTYKYNCVFSDGEKFKMTAISIKNGKWPQNSTNYLNRINSLGKK